MCGSVHYVYIFYSSVNALRAVLFNTVQYSTVLYSATVQLIHNSIVHFQYSVVVLCTLRAGSLFETNKNTSKRALRQIHTSPTYSEYCAVLYSTVYRLLDCTVNVRCTLQYCTVHTIVYSTVHINSSKPYSTVNAAVTALYCVAKKDPCIQVIM